MWESSDVDIIVVTFWDRTHEQFVREAIKAIDFDLGECPALYRQNRKWEVFYHNEIFVF